MIPHGHVSHEQITAGFWYLRLHREKAPFYTIVEVVPNVLGKNVFLMGDEHPYVVEDFLPDQFISPVPELGV